MTNVDCLNLSIIIAAFVMEIQALLIGLINRLDKGTTLFVSPGFYVQ